MFDDRFLSDEHNLIEAPFSNSARMDCCDATTEMMDSVDKSVGRGTPQTVVIEPFDEFNYESSSVGLDRFKSLRLTQRETHTMCFDQKKRNLPYY